MSPRESKEYDPNVDSPVSFEAEPLGEDESLVAGGSAVLFRLAALPCCHPILIAAFGEVHRQLPSSEWPTFFLERKIGINAHLHRSISAGFSR